VTQVGLIREDYTDPYVDRGSHLGQLHVFLTPQTTQGRRHADVIIEELREKTDELGDLFEEVIYQKVRAGPPVGKPVSIRLRGDEFPTLEEIAEKLKAKLNKLEGLRDVRDDYDVGKPELLVIVDEEKAAKTYLTVRKIANAVRNALDGGEATTIKKVDEEIDVIVRYPKEERTSREMFNRAYIPNRFDNLIPLNKVATLQEAEGVRVIKHLDRKKMVTVTAELNEKIITPMKVEKVMSRFYEEEIRDAYPGVFISFGGEQEETKESLGDFWRAFAFGFFTICVILAAYFNSMVLAI